MRVDGILAASNVAANTQAVFFWILAPVAVLAALGMVLARKAVHSAILLAVVMLVLAVFYAMQGAPFLAFTQIIVYTGAVLMLFLFVLMLVGVSSLDSMKETIRGQRLLAAILVIALLVLLAVMIGHAAIGPAAPASSGYGAANIQGLARLIFNRYVFAFEVTSALLITAALGAMVLAHRERTSPKLTQRDLSRQRIASGQPAPLPGPGVYARHDAADLPALLPDGSPAPGSVSAAIAGRTALRGPGEAPPEVAPGLPAGGAAPAETEQEDARS